MEDHGNLVARLNEEGSPLSLEAARKIEQLRLMGELLRKNVDDTRVLAYTAGQTAGPHREDMGR